MLILPEELALHRARFNTATVEWLVAVDNVKQTQSADNLLLNLILEQKVDEEQFLSRALGLIVPAAVARDPETCGQILDRIRDWLETTEGDGFLRDYHLHARLEYNSDHAKCTSRQSPCDVSVLVGGSHRRSPFCG